MSVEQAYLVGLVVGVALGIPSGVWIVGPLLDRLVDLVRRPPVHDRKA